MEHPKDVLELFQVTDWLQWEQLKDSIANEFGRLIDRFKKDYDVWTKWHLVVTRCHNE
jgi:hypothetical protein